MAERQPPHFSLEHVQDLNGHEEIGKQAVREAKKFFEASANTLYDSSFASLNEKQKQSVRDMHYGFNLGFDDVISMRRRKYGPRLTPKPERRQAPPAENPRT